MPRVKAYHQRLDARFTERQRFILSNIAAQLGLSEAAVLRALVDELDPDFPGIRIAERLHASAAPPAVDVPVPSAPPAADVPMPPAPPA